MTTNSVIGDAEITVFHGSVDSWRDCLLAHNSVQVPRSPRHASALTAEIEWIDTFLRDDLT